MERYGRCNCGRACVSCAIEALKAIIERDSYFVNHLLRECRKDFDFLLSKAEVTTFSRFSSSVLINCLIVLLFFLSSFANKIQVESVDSYDLQVNGN